MNLSVIIVAYRSTDKLRATLSALFKSVTQLEYEVIVVDNDSQDGTFEMVVEEFPKVKIIKNQNNGFSKGNNVGLQQSSGEVILFLNPDTAVEVDVLEECYKKINSDKQIGFLSSRLIKEDGSLDISARRAFPNPVNSFYRFTNLDKVFPKYFGSYNLRSIPENQEQEVDSVVGAFMMIRRDVIDKIGKWDEDFFMYGEDIEYCYRAKQAGYKNIYFPKVTTVHYRGQSSKIVPYFSMYHFHNSMWIFYKKHYLEKYPFFVSWLVFLGIWMRFYLLVIVNKIRKNPYVSK
jgi:GT2 family glycosyltransferase